MKLIGLIGRARSGKDTVARYLAMQHKFTHVAFADPMKEMLEAAFGDLFRDGDREQPIDWLGKSPRQLMQTLGTEWGRNQVHQDIWTLLMEQKILEQKALDEVGFGTNMVISDVRFYNEADMILKHGGELWQIQRDTAETVNAHVSEQYSWDTYQTKTLDNNGSLAELFLQVEEAYQGETFTRFIEQVKVFSQESNPKLCRCDHKLQGTGAVFYQSTKLLQCSNCHGWQQVRKPIEV